MLCNRTTQKAEVDFYLLIFELITLSITLARILHLKKVKMVNYICIYIIFKIFI